MEPSLYLHPFLRPNEGLRDLWTCRRKSVAEQSGGGRYLSHSCVKVVVQWFRENEEMRVLSGWYDA